MPDNWQLAISEQDRIAFRELIQKTRTCMGSPDRTSQGGLECETAYLSNNDYFTFHTHPNGTPFPSEIDKKTTARFNKQYLMIGLVPSNEVVVYSKRDNYTKMVGRFKA